MALLPAKRSGHIQITGEKKGDFISLSINDNGCGITQEKLDFLRVNPRPLKKLHLVYVILKKGSGCIWVILVQLLLIRTEYQVQNPYIISI